MFVIRKEMEFALPPRGITKHVNMLGGKKFIRVTWRCEEDGCWFVRLLPNDYPQTLDDARRMHKEGTYGFHCPSPPMREALPSGLPEIEKLWRELDDVTDALVGKTPYRDMEGAELKAYAQGISFSIVMKDKELFPDITSVSKEAVVRWKMRNDKAPYRKTPTTQNTNGSWVVNGGWSEADHGSVAKVLPAKSPVNTPAIQNGKSKLDPLKIQGIKNGLTSGMFTHSELASMYAVPEALILQIGAGTYGAEVG